jgi:hypothetical protein
MTAQNDQINIQSLGFVEYASDYCAFHQERRDISMPFPPGLSEMLQRLVFMAKLPGHLLS